MLRLIKNNSRYLSVWVLIAIILCGFALYFVPIQSTSFCDDDHASIEKNAAIKTIDIPKIFTAFNTRSLVGLSFALNYKCCALHPFGYRLINLLIHCLNAFLVYLLVKTTLYLYSAHKPVLFCRLGWPAFLASMLFLCHPIQTEPVNFITQRFVLMGTFFYLLTLFLYIQYRCQFKKGYLIAGMASAIAAMFCKEFVVTLPLMLVLYDFYFLDALVEPWWKRCSRVLPFFVIILIVPILLLRTPPETIGVANIADSYFIPRGDTQGFENHVDITRARYSIGRQQYFLTELHVMCTYVRLLFLPIHQNLDYDYPLSSKMDNKTALCGVFLLCLLALAVVTYKSYRLVSFGILWFFIALSVESSFIPIGDVIAEYRLYLAGFGFVILVMSLIYMRRVDVKKLNMVMAAILIGCSILTYQRNQVWKSEFTLLNDTIRKSPHKARLYNNRGLIYDKEDDLINAISDYNKAIAINPSNALFYYNRGRTYAKPGDFIQAMSDYNKSIALNPKYADAYNNRALIYDKQGAFPQAMFDFNKAIETDPDDADAYSNRGVSYTKRNNFTQAMLDFNKAIKLDPQNVGAYNNRGLTYEKQGNFTQALSNYDKVIKINPSDAEGYYNRGRVYAKLNNFTQAISDYNKTIELSPKYAQAYNNRGGIYCQQGNFAKGLSDFNKVIEINSNYADAYYNRGIFYDNQGNFTQALSDYNKAIEINPQYALAYNNRAVLYYQLKEYDKAWADVHKVEALGMRVNPEFIKALKQVTSPWRQAPFVGGAWGRD
jgi:tetratricopeptide (TPR) repeat protein